MMYLNHVCIINIYMNMVISCMINLGFFFPVLFFPIALPSTNTMTSFLLVRIYIR